MILYERNNLIFFFVIFLCLQTSSQQDKMNKTDIFHYNGGLEKKSDPEEKKGMEWYGVFINNLITN